MQHSDTKKSTSLKIFPNQLMCENAQSARVTVASRDDLTSFKLVESFGEFRIILIEDSNLHQCGTITRKGQKIRVRTGKSFIVKMKKNGH